MERRRTRPDAGEAFAMSRRPSAGVNGQRGFRLSCDRIRVQDMLARGLPGGPRDATPLSLGRRDGCCPGRIEGHPGVRSAARCPQRRAPRPAGAVRDPADQCQAQSGLRGLERCSPAAEFDPARSEGDTLGSRPNAARVPDSRAPSRPRHRHAVHVGRAELGRRRAGRHQYFRSDRPHGGCRPGLLL